MKLYILFIIGLLSLAMPIQAQNIKREGNTFTQLSTTKEKGKETPTEYKYVDSKGEVHTVYLSSTGKAFIWVTSKKTGKPYKKYLPEIGKIINPNAYKDK